MVDSVVNPTDGRDRVPSDRHLIQDCLRGDSRSFAELYRRHQQRVRSTLYQLCGADRLDDLVQETFLRAWRGLPKFRQSAQFSTWLYRIAWNVASDCRQDLARDRDRLAAMQRSFQEGGGGGGGPHREALMRLHYQELVQQGLGQLSFDTRTVVVLCDLEDLPQKEVARILGIPVGTVKSRLSYGRSSLRQYMERQGVQL
ncbi:MAG: sigma-70 family RNA polymerase sigma factor [Cyanobacteria bacterium]|nr:sigma-70 family RNA polymerase sigma factor [Cyanobacteriota bacterium]